MKRLSTTDMQELAKRALEDCDTMEDVVALIEEYVK